MGPGKVISKCSGASPLPSCHFVPNPHAAHPGERSEAVLRPELSRIILLIKTLVVWGVTVGPGRDK